jgi:hypothetical protein
MIDVVGPQRKVNSEFEAGDQNLEERKHLPSPAGKWRLSTLPGVGVSVGRPLNIDGY